MKKYFKLIYRIMLASFLLCLGIVATGCGKNDDIVPAATANPSHNEGKIDADDITLPESYDLDIWTTKFWDGTISYYEPVSFTQDAEGNLIAGKLLYEPEEILEVRSGVGFKQLYEGKDYGFEDGKFTIPDSIVLVEGRDYTVTDGKIKLSYKQYLDVMTYDELFPLYKEGEAKTWLALPSDNSRYINIDGTIKNAQMYVTYTHKTTWSGYVPTSQTDHLPKTFGKLNNKVKLNFYVYGDSIATGADCTGNKESCIDVNTLKSVQYNGNAAPNTPSWAEMVTSKMRQVYGYDDIVKINKAAGSSESSWGVKNAQYLLCSDNEKVPDIVVIAFGMNEPGRTAQSFKDNLNQIINTVLAVNPDCEFVLMSSIESNPMYGSTNFMDHEKAMYEIQSERKDVGIAVCPVNSVYHAMTDNGKTFFDLTSNNINHPNDFLGRVYAMTLLASLGI